MKKILNFLLIISALMMSLAANAYAEDVFKVKGVTATSLSQTAGAEMTTIDGDTLTSWAAEGVIDIWIQWELDKVETLPGITLAFAKGDERQAKFDILVSENGKDFKNALVGGLSSGESTDFEEFAFTAPVKAKYVKFIGLGNSKSFWNNIAEVKFPKKLTAGGSISTGEGGVKIVSKLDYVIENAAIYKADNAIALYKGERFEANVPAIYDGYMMVPLRATVEKTGGNIMWDEITRMTACTINNSVLKFSDKSTKVEVNGKNHEMNSAARIINDRFCIPLRDFADNTKQNVMWYNDHKIAVISEIALPELSKWELLELNDRLTN